MNVVIRLANPSDGEKLWALAEKYIEEQVALGNPDQRKVLAMGIQYGVRRGEAIVVAEKEGGELVGFVAWAALPNVADGEVVGMGTYVAPEFRRQMLSVEMREFAKDYCRERGGKFVSGAVFGENEAGLRAAKRTGAKVRGYLVEWAL